MAKTPVKRAERKGWSLVKKDNTYYVKTRLNHEKKVKFITTKQKDIESAMLVAVEIARDLRKALAITTITGDNDGSGYPYSTTTQTTVENGAAIIDAENKYAQEEEKFLGNELDKTNPRLSTLWTFGDADAGETITDDKGLYCENLKNNRSLNVFTTRRPTYKHFFSLTMVCLRL